MESSVRNLDAVLASFDEIWSPRVVAQVNDWGVKLAKLQGNYVWHSHQDTDELFVVLDGSLEIHLRHPDIEHVRLTRHDVFVVPKGIEHRPVSQHGAVAMLLEPAETLSTGDFEGEIPAHITSTTGIPT